MKKTSKKKPSEKLYTSEQIAKKMGISVEEFYRRAEAKGLIRRVQPKRVRIEALVTEEVEKVIRESAKQVGISRTEAAGRVLKNALLGQQ